MIMNSRIVAILALAFSSSMVYAMGDDAKRQEMFSKMKQIKVEGIQGRITIMQNALDCVNAATSHDQMKPCEEQERKEMESLQQQQKAKWEAAKPQK
jgi:hypothetical protein